MEKLKVLSLFSGIGAFEKALTNLGVDFELRGFCENDKYAIDSYCAIHNTNKNLNLGDITQVNPKDISFDIDLLTHGSPCQSFSVIGKQEGGDEGSETKSSLLWYSVNIIKQKRPKYIVWENVKNVLSPNHKHNFDKYIETLNEEGYNSYYKIFNSSDYGVPQNRERIFVVSIRKDIDRGQYVIPEPLKLMKNMFDFLDKSVDEKYIVPNQVMLGYKNKKSIFRKRFLLKKMNDIAYCLIAKSGRSVITNNYIFNDFKMYDNPPCELNDLDFLVDNKIPVRALTPLEYFRLQGFSDKDFDKVQTIGMSDAQIYKQAGNSITVDVPQAIFKELLKDYIIE